MVSRRPVLVAAGAAVCLAVVTGTLPVAAADDADFRGGCSIEAVHNDAATPQSYTGEINVVIVATDASADRVPNPTLPIAGTACDVYVNGVLVQPNALTAPDAVGLTAAVGRLEYVASASDTVVACTRVTVAATPITRCADQAGTQVPPAAVVDLLAAVGAIANDALQPLDPAVCGGLKALAEPANDAGSAWLSIDPSTGDTRVLGRRFYDCPPYDEECPGQRVDPESACATAPTADDVGAAVVAADVEQQDRRRAIGASVAAAARPVVEQVAVLQTLDYFVDAIRISAPNSFVGPLASYEGVFDPAKGLWDCTFVRTGMPTVVCDAVEYTNIEWACAIMHVGAKAGPGGRVAGYVSCDNDELVTAQSTGFMERAEAEMGSVVRVVCRAQLAPGVLMRPTIPYDVVCVDPPKIVPADGEARSGVR